MYVYSFLLVGPNVEKPPREVIQYLAYPFHQNNAITFFFHALFLIRAHVSYICQ